MRPGERLIDSGNPDAIGGRWPRMKAAGRSVAEIAEELGIARLSVSIGRARPAG
jgi:hypothetical protein